jgi:carbamoyl-phosphate synthase small subunit
MSVEMIKLDENNGGIRMQKSVYIVLENGQVFKGEPFGALGEVVGEIVFTTGMTGYLETLTDPSYYGQMVVQTFPLIGNYGIIPSDYESASPKLMAYIVREWCQAPSNFRCEGELDTFLRAHNIVGVSGIDTRELTKIIREYGVMNAKITTKIDDLNAVLEEIKGYKVMDAVQSVSTKEISISKGLPGASKVVLWDFGAKDNIQRELVKRGCEVVTVPSDTTAATILELMPDGVMLSNGPGDPAENNGIIKELAELCTAQVPIFGICLGHQLLALSQVPSFALVNRKRACAGILSATTAYPWF